MWQKGFCFRGGGGMLGLLESGKGRFRGSARVSSHRSVLPRPRMFQGEKERNRSTNHQTKKAPERSTDITLNSSQTRKCTNYTGGSGTGTPMYVAGRRRAPVSRTRWAASKNTRTNSTRTRWVFGAAKGAAFSGIVLLFIGLQGSEMQATTPTVALSAHVHPHAPQRPAMACMLEFMPRDSRP